MVDRMVLSSDSLASMLPRTSTCEPASSSVVLVPHPVSAEPASAMATMAGTAARFTSICPPLIVFC
ncbi:hypothetical protein ATO49_23690 [Mycolicibacterium fortuitum subsp. fortuitum DSM 46621 = ATCC 6841 = JCM 6387]|nr:hypothetical protein ATO49_23690 [Mycolicibacterium fortuitum subsp. fortuitum DSM 46621 = ATCC 6841 = JCM 6387]